MSTSPDFVAHCLELLAPLGMARSRRMFGGHGLYLDDLFIAILADDTLYLKADAVNRSRFEAAACTPFRVTTSRGEGVLSYYTAPEDAMESPALMAPWVRLAVDAALRGRQTAVKTKAASKKPRRLRPS